MSNIKVSLPVNDSLRIRFSVRTETGALLPLTGFTVSVVVKASATQAAPVVAQATGAVQNPDTSALIVVPPDTLTTAGTFYATVRAANVNESYSDTFIITTYDHA